MCLLLKYHSHATYFKLVRSILGSLPKYAVRRKIIRVSGGLFVSGMPTGLFTDYCYMYLVNIVNLIFIEATSSRDTLENKLTQDENPHARVKFITDG